MALIKVPTTKRDTEAVNWTYGLNTEKMGNFFVDGGVTVFYYNELENRRRKSIRYETTLTYTQLKDKFTKTLEGGKDVSELKRRLNLRVVAYGPNDTSWQKDVNVDANKIQYIWDDGNYARVVLDNAAFDTLQYKTEESLDDILYEASTSASA